MPTTLPNSGMQLPARGAGGAGLWGDTLDANLQILDIHDHTSGKFPRVPTAGLNINADLPFSALWAPTQLHRVQFSAIAVSTVTGGMTKSLFVSDGTGGLVANELYYRTNAGASVQITAGSALNVGAFVAGIGGDYAGVGAQLNYTDSSKTYDFKESTADSHGWARLQCGGIRLIEFNTTENFFVAQIAPAALAVSYTTTWPTALPGSQVLSQIDATGQMIWSNTVPNAVTFSSTVTLAANQNLVFSGTGKVSGQSVNHGFSCALALAGSGVTKNIASGSAGANLQLLTSSNANTLPIFGLPVGSTLTSWKVRVVKTSASGTIVAKLWKIDHTAASNLDGTQIGSTQSNNAVSPGNISLGETVSSIVADDSSYYVELSGGGTTGDLVLGWSATVTL